MAGLVGIGPRMSCMVGIGPLMSCMVGISPHMSCMVGIGPLATSYYQYIVHINIPLPHK